MGGWLVPGSWRARVHARQPALVGIELGTSSAKVVFMALPAFAWGSSCLRRGSDPGRASTGNPGIRARRRLCPRAPTAGAASCRARQPGLGVRRVLTDCRS